jgi:hypothetical protein
VAEVVSDRIWRAMVDGSAALSQLGVGHALVGALAVGAHGWPRATGDVDFLVDDSAWTKTPAGLVVMRAGLPGPPLPKKTGSPSYFARTPFFTTTSTRWSRSMCVSTSPFTAITSA